MSFGNRSNYCSLDDAFGVKSFSVNVSPIHNTEQHSYNYTVDKPVKEALPIVEELQTLQTKEKFHDGSMDCNCKKYKTYGPVGTTLNEVLNIILISILLFIILYKPNF
jgi:hypothetical protein